VTAHAYSPEPPVSKEFILEGLNRHDKGNPGREILARGILMADQGGTSARHLGEMAASNISGGEF
jgi:hypothetical protein